MRIKRFKSFICVMLSILMLMSSMAYADTAGTDVAKCPDIVGNKYEVQLREWVDNGFIKGDQNGNFKPGNTITRAEFMALVNRSFGFMETMEVNYTDVSRDKWFYEDVAKATKAGYMKGNNGKIMPSDPISRQEFAIVLARLAHIEAIADDKVLESLSDGKTIPDWSKAAISTAISKGYFRELIDKTFKPTEKITRLETVVALDRAFKSMYKAVYTKKGTYGPASGMVSLDGSVAVISPDVTLMNTTISGDLILRETIGDGNVYLDNVVVKGTTVVKGGGENSIVIRNSSLGKVTVIKEGNTVRIVATGSTTIGEVNVQSGVKLEEEFLTGQGFGDIVIPDDILAGANIILEGVFEDVEVSSNNANINVESGSIGNLTLTQEAAGTTVNLKPQASVNTLNLNAAVNITGQGSIQTANVNASGSTIQQQPKNVVTAPGVTMSPQNPTPTPAPTPGPAAPSSGGSNGGGGGDNGNDDDDDEQPPTVVINAIGDMEIAKGDVRDVTVLSTPSNAVITAASSKRNIVEVSVTGNTVAVTGLIPGTSTITVTASKYGFNSASEQFTVTVKPKDYTGEAALAYVKPLDFSAGKWSNVSGYNVGIELLLSKSDLISIDVSLYKGNELLSTNTSRRAIMEFVPNISTPFNVNGSFAGDDYWTYGGWSKPYNTVPDRVVIKVTDKEDNTYTVENSNLSGDPSVIYTITGDEALAYVQPENFNTHSGADYKGINVGFRLGSLNISNLEAIEVCLYNGKGLLATNTANSEFMKLDDLNKQHSTPFIIQKGIYNEPYWILDDHPLNADIKPDRAEIKITDKAGNVYLVENDYFAEPDGVTYESLFVVDTIPVEVINAGRIYGDLWGSISAGTTDKSKYTDVEVKFSEDFHLSIGDVVISYWTKDDNGQYEEITGSDGKTIVKNRYWDGYLTNIETGAKVSDLIKADTIYGTAINSTEGGAKYATQAWWEALWAARDSGNGVWVKFEVTDDWGNTSTTYAQIANEFDIPMAINAETPTFIAGKKSEFTVTTVANDDEGKLVRAYFTLPEGANVEYYEVSDGKWYPLGSVYGPAEGFPVADATSRFRATFIAEGTYTVHVEFKMLDGKVVGSKDISATVSPTPEAALPAVNITTILPSGSDVAAITDGDINIIGNITVYTDGSTNIDGLNFAAQHPGVGSDPNRGYIGFKLSSSFESAKTLDMKNASGTVNAVNAQDGDGFVYLYVPVAQKGADGIWTPRPITNNTWTLTWKDAEGNIAGINTLHVSGTTASAALPAGNITTALPKGADIAAITEGDISIKGNIVVNLDGSTNIDGLNFAAQHPGVGSDPNRGYIGFKLESSFDGAKTLDMKNASGTVNAVNAQDGDGLVYLYVPVAQKGADGIWTPRPITDNTWTLTWKDAAGSIVGVNTLHVSGTTASVPVALPEDNITTVLPSGIEVAVITAGDINITGNITVYTDGSTNIDGLNFAAQHPGVGGNPDYGYIAFRLDTSFTGAKALHMKNLRNTVDVDNAQDGDGYVLLYVPVAQKNAEGKWSPRPITDNTWMLIWKDADGNIAGINTLHVSGTTAVSAAVAEALAEVNGATSANNYAEMQTAIETNAETLGLDLIDYNTLIPGRKPAVSNDLYNSKPAGGYTLETLKLAFDEIVETRIVFQNSMDMVNAATAENPLTDVTYITMLIDNLSIVQHYTKHSGIEIGTLIADLQSLVDRYNALSSEKQTAVLKTVSSADYASSTQTRNALDAALISHEFTSITSYMESKVVEDKYYRFGVGTEAGGNKNKTVRVRITLDNPDQKDNIFLEYLENDGYYHDLGFDDYGVAWYGPTEGFPLIDATSEFQVMFNEPGTYGYKLEIVETGTGDILASEEENVEAMIKMWAVSNAQYERVYWDEQSFSTNGSTVYGKLSGETGNTIFLVFNYNEDKETYEADYQDIMPIGDYEVELFRDAEYQENIGTGTFFVSPMPHVTSGNFGGYSYTEQVTISGFISNYDKDEYNSLTTVVNEGEPSEVVINDDGSYSCIISLVPGDNHVELNLEFDYEGVTHGGYHTGRNIKCLQGLSTQIISYMESKVVEDDHYRFNVETEAGENLDKTVRVRITLNDPSQKNNVFLEYRDDEGIYQPLVFDESGVVWYGPESGFPLNYATSRFQVEFTEPGTYGYKLEVVEVGTGDILAETQESVDVLIRSRVYPTTTGYEFGIKEGSIDSLYDTMYGKLMKADEQIGEFTLEYSEGYQGYIGHYEEELEIGRYDIELFASEDYDYSGRIGAASFFMSPMPHLSPNFHTSTVDTDTLNITGYISNYDGNSYNKLTAGVENVSEIDVPINENGEFSFDVALAEGENIVYVYYEYDYPQTDGDYYTDRCITRGELDTVPPQLIEAVVSGNILTLKYDEELEAEHLPYADEFTTNINGLEVIPCDDTFIWNDTVYLYLSLSTLIHNGDTITISYDSENNPVQDIAGNFAGEIDGFKVTNVTPEADSYEIIERGNDDTENGWASEINFGGTQSHTISPVGDYDLICFNITDLTKSYTISTYNLSDGMDTYIYLYSPEDNYIAENDDMGGLESEITFTPEAEGCTSEGYYYVAVKHYSLYGAGSYDITVTASDSGDTGAIGASMSIMSPERESSYRNEPVKVDFIVESGVREPKVKE